MNEHTRFPLLPSSAKWQMVYKEVLATLSFGHYF